MSFSQEVRQELSVQVSSARHCNLAELAAIIGMAGEIGVSGVEKMNSDAQEYRCYLRIRTENLSVARKSFTLLEKTFNICSRVSVHLHKGAKRSGGESPPSEAGGRSHCSIENASRWSSAVESPPPGVGGRSHCSIENASRWSSAPVYTVQVQSSESVRQIMRALKLTEGGVRRETGSRILDGLSMETPPPEVGGRSHCSSKNASRWSSAEEGIRPVLSLPQTADPLLVQQSCCRRAYIRGAFLCAGSISNPEKSYHFEIACSSAGCAQQLRALIRTFGPDAKIVQRKKQYIVYIKEGDQIVNMLNIMEAHISLMNLENIRIVRDMRNTVNRKVNCEAANINKTVGAAVRQIEDIRYLEAMKGLDSLPAGLADIAELRLANPDASLKELGEMSNPPVGKSGVNHRLRKLSRLAEMVRQNKEELL